MKKVVVFLVLVVILTITGYFNEDMPIDVESSGLSLVSVDIDNIPKYSGNPYVYINNNVPSFAENNLAIGESEYYSRLDSLGRCGVVYANICKNIMPAEDEERQWISDVTPSGWKQVSYKGVIDGNYLYNRCRLIGYQLTGENANERNLITGTRYLNVEGMLRFENMVAEYIDTNPNNHIVYRVTPLFLKGIIF